MSISLAIALGINTIAVKSLEMTQQVKKSPPALYGADTGIERALYDISKGNADVGSSTDELSFDLEDNKVRYDYNIIDHDISPELCPEDAMYCIYSTGSYRGSARTLKVTR